MSDKYILDGHTVVPATSLKQWAEWMKNKPDRRVRDETINGVRVSTVFLGLDHSFGPGPKQLFETMVFGGALDGEMDRCATWAEAEEMHDRMVARVKVA
jgi:hypothetical protein